jgi:Tfp pilus assembly protein PilX
MADQTPAKQGVRARERNALERITSLEGDMGSLFSAVQSAVGELEKRIVTAAEVIDAIVRVLGQDVVEKSVIDAREERAAKSAVDAKEGLNKALEAKQVVPADKIVDDSIITGVESDKDGVALKPGYVQLSMAGVKTEYKDKMLGQSVGFKFDTTDGNTFTVTGIYASVPQPEVPVLTPEVA